MCNSVTLSNHVSWLNINVWSFAVPVSPSGDKQTALCSRLQSEPYHRHSFRQVTAQKRSRIEQIGAMACLADFWSTLVCCRELLLWLTITTTFYIFSSWLSVAVQQKKCCMLNQLCRKSVCVRESWLSAFKRLLHWFSIALVRFTLNYLQSKIKIDAAEAEMLCFLLAYVAFGCLRQGWGVDHRGPVSSLLSPHP